MPVATADLTEILTVSAELAWLASAIGIIGWTLFMHWRFCRRVRRTAVCRDERLLRLGHASCAQAGLRTSLPIVIFDGVDQPAVTGLWHAELLLPPRALNLSDDELQMILLHELAHVRRWDLAVNWGLVAIRALHWWNPVYWLASARFQNLREQACDAFAVNAMDGRKCRDYGELLLNLAEHAPAARGWRVIVPASMLGILQSYFRKRTLRLRLQALRTSAVRRSPWQKGAAAVLILCAALCGLTDAQTRAVPVDHPRTAELWLPERFDWNTLRTSAEEPNLDQPLETRAYSIGGIIRHAERDGAQPDQYLFEIESFVSHTVEYARKAREASPANGTAPDKIPTGAGCRLDGETLIVKATPAMHDKVATMLSAWEMSGMAQLTVECRLMTSSRELAAECGVKWRSLSAESFVQNAPFSAASAQAGTVVQASARVEDHLPVFATPLNEREWKAIVEMAQSDSGSNVMFAPKITLFNGQQAQIADCVRRPFVVGMDSQPGEAAQPRVEIIDEGTKLTLRTVLREDRKHVQLAGTIEMTSIVDIGTASASPAAGNVTVQVPRVRRCRIAVASEAEDGQPLLIGCLPSFDRKEFFYVMLTVRVIEQ
jgi:bla regulator protein BlaR1